MAVAIGVVMLGSAASSGAAVKVKASAAKAKVVKIDLIDDLTGIYTTVNNPQPVKAYIKDLNAHGGIDGHKVSLKIYDGQSTAAGALQAARRVIQDKPAGVFIGSTLATSAAEALAAAGIPTVGFGDIPGYSGHKGVFSDVGDGAGHQTDAWIKALINHGDKKLALLSASIEAGPLSLEANLAPKDGGSVVYTNTGLPYPLDSPTALSLAQSIQSSGATGVLVFGGGGDAIQADLNQLGDKATVLEVSVFGPSVIKQWGTKVNGMMYGAEYASAYVKNAGTKKYIADMRAAGYASDIYSVFDIEQYAGTEMLAQGLTSAGAPFSHGKVIAALNKLHNYTAGGILPDVSFPAFHKIGSNCISTATVVNGQWKASTKKYPFTCGSGSVPVS